MTFLGLSWSGWLLWLAIFVGITVRCLNMWAYGPNSRLQIFRHDGRLFRTVMPICGLVIGTLAWSWGTYGTAVANLVLAVAMTRPDIVARRRWLTRLLGSRTGMVTMFVLVPLMILVTPTGSLAERAQLAGGYQLIVGFFGLLAGSWAGDSSADTWHWLAICLSVDLLLGAGAIALAATPIIVLEIVALTMDLAKLTRKVSDARRQHMDVRVSVPPSST
jgi:hypothetical protein